MNSACKAPLSLILLLILFQGCKEDDISNGPDTETNEQSGVLEADAHAIDAAKSLLVYNGKNIRFDSLVVIENDTFNISPLDSELILGKPYEITNSRATYTLYRTEMPLAVLHTGDEEIVDEPKIAGELKVLESGKEPYESVIGIEIRGAFSQRFPKKSYSFELWESAQEEGDIREPLLGLREDDDWILDGLWNEPLHIRDFTSHDLWLQMHRLDYASEEKNTTYGINRKYCEVFLNGDYRGIYYLGEKIDRKQLDLKKYDEGLRGELYKNDQWAPGIVFSGVEEFSNASDRWNGYEAQYPDEEGEIDWKNLYDAVDYVVNTPQPQFNAQPPENIDLQNLVDYFIFMNVTYAENNRGKNIYMARHDKDLPFFFLPWDMDGTFGRRFDGERFENTDSILSYTLYLKLSYNPFFVAELKSRWAELKNTVLSASNVHGMFRENYTYLKNNGAYDREALGTDLAHNYSESEIDFITSWYDARMVFMDNYISNLE